jgi:hypothetical protein
MLRFASGNSYGKKITADSNWKPPNNDFPAFWYRMLTEEFRISAEGRIKYLFGKGASGICDVGQVYDHQANKPTIAKIIIEIAKNGGGTIDDLVDLFKGEGSSQITASIRENLTESTQKLLSRTRVDPHAVNTKETILQELSIRMSQWVKEAAKLADKNVELHGALTANMEPRVRQELAKQPEFREIEDNSDGLALGRLVTKMLSVASTKHRHIAKSEADAYYNDLRHGKEDVHYYKSRFDEALLRRKAAGLDDIKEVDQARHFIDKLDMDRFGEAVADLHNE